MAYPRSSLSDYNQLLSQGMELSQDREHRAAIDIFYKAHQLESQSAEPMLGLAQSRLAMEHFDAALYWADRVLRIDPMNADAWLARWTALRASAPDFGSARKTIQSEIDALKSNADASYAALFAAYEGLELLNDRTAANALWPALVQKMPNGDQHRVGMRLFEAILQTHVPKERLPLTRLYLVKFAEHQMSTTVVHVQLRMLASLNPEAAAWDLAHEVLDQIEGYWRGYFGLAFWLMNESGNVQALIPVLKQALLLAELRPASRPPDFNDAAWERMSASEKLLLRFILAEALLRVGDDGKALELLDSIAGERPLWPGVRNALGESLRKQGRDSEALEHYRAAMRLSHRYPQAEKAMSELIAELFDFQEGARDYFIQNEQPPVFTDITEAVGLSEVKAERVAWGDADGDGDEDLLLNGHRLFFNEGGARFDESTSWLPQLSESNGGIWGDWNNDGLLDLIVTGRKKNYLLKNTGSRFTDVSADAWGERPALFTEAAAWGDLNNDGWLDLYLANIERPGLGRGFCQSDQLWQNQSGSGWQEKASELGLVTDEAYCGRGVTWTDLDADGYQEIVVSNYRLDPNLVWGRVGDSWQDRAGEFGARGTGTAGAFGHSIGAASGDINADGKVDLLITNLAHPRYIQYSDRNMLLMNTGIPFSDNHKDSGITFEESNSDPALGDIDNDGDLDLYISSVYAGRMSHLYLNDGNGYFSDVTWLSGARVANGWGVAFADFDKDGDLDLLVASRAGVKLLRNDSPPRNWLQVEVNDGNCQRQGVGAIVEVVAGDKRSRREIQAGRGTGSQDSLVQHFGLGGYDGPVSIEVTTLCGQHYSARLSAPNQRISMPLER